MFEKRANIYRVTILACIIGSLFTICSFALTVTSPFTVPTNFRRGGIWYFYYSDSQGNSAYTTGPIYTDGSFSISRPSDFSTEYEFRQERIEFHPFLTDDVQSGNTFYGITLASSNFYSPVSTITPTIKVGNTSINGWCSWNSMGSVSIQSVNTQRNPYIKFMIQCYHPINDGGNLLTSADFPLHGVLQRSTGTYNYADPTTSGSGSPSGSGSSSSNVDQNIQATYNSVTTLIADTNDGFTNISSQLTTMEGGLSSSLEWMAYNLSTLTNGLNTGSTWEDSDGNSFDYPVYNQLSFDLYQEHVRITSVQKCGTFLGILSRKFDELFEFFKFQFEIFFQWFYPLKDSTPQYWAVYNTDNNSTAWVNPATVTYYITWYLGQLYSQNYADSNGALSDLADAVDDFATDAASFESQEHAVVDSVKAKLDTFVPSISSWLGFNALAWCSNYLQQVFLALGSYGTVISIGLLLGVCLQFIGYFRYK